MTRIPDVVTVSTPVDGAKTPRRRAPRTRPAGARNSRIVETQMHPGIISAAWCLRREGEVMRAAGPNVIILAHPGSAAYIEATSQT